MLARVVNVLFKLVSLLIIVTSIQIVNAQRSHLPYQLKYDVGQTIQPIFQGWSRNDDGSREMHFGYLNRNYSVTYKVM